MVKPRLFYIEKLEVLIHEVVIRNLRPVPVVRKRPNAGSERNYMYNVDNL